MNPVQAYAVDPYESFSASISPSRASNPLRHVVNEAAVREFLSELNWALGLQDAVIQGLRKVPIRYFICDDSGSMNEGDGSRLVQVRGKYAFVSSSRWRELTDALCFHIDLVKAAGTIAEFRLLNGAAPMVISPECPENASVFKSLLQSSPSGGTPLCHQIREVIAQIQLHEGYLRANGQKACVIIATDGESSDGDIAEAMKPLERLPCWVVVRLCTNNERIVEYWNKIDNALELDIDVLDDLQGEATEINRKNGWLTYGEPLHRLREFGISIKEIDLLDEQALSPDQITVIASNILGGRPDSFPNPQLEASTFISYIESKQAHIPKIYDPISNSMQPWFKTKEIRKVMSKTGGCAVM